MVINTSSKEEYSDGRISKLVKQAKSGNTDAFGKLYDIYYPKIYRYIYWRINNKEDVEDLTEQVFLNVWQGLKKYRFKGIPFISWLYRIAHNLVVDFYRTKKETFELKDKILISEKTSPEDVLQKKFQQKRLISAIKNLTDIQQQIIYFKFFDDLTNKEISHIVRKSEGAVRVIQCRALKSLRKILKNHDK